MSIIANEIAERAVAVTYPTPSWVTYKWNLDVPTRELVLRSMDESIEKRIETIKGLERIMDELRTRRTK